MSMLARLDELDSILHDRFEQKQDESSVFTECNRIRQLLPQFDDESRSFYTKATEYSEACFMHDYSKSKCGCSKRCKHKLPTPKKVENITKYHAPACQASRDRCANLLQLKLKDLQKLLLTIKDKDMKYNIENLIASVGSLCDCLKLNEKEYYQSTSVKFDYPKDYFELLVTSIDMEKRKLYDMLVKPNSEKDEKDEKDETSDSHTDVNNSHTTNNNHNNSDSTNTGDTNNTNNNHSDNNKPSKNIIECISMLDIVMVLFCHYKAKFNPIKVDLSALVWLYKCAKTAVAAITASGFTIAATVATPLICFGVVWGMGRYYDHRIAILQEEQNEAINRIVASGANPRQQLLAISRIQRVSANVEQSECKDTAKKMTKVGVAGGATIGFIFGGPIGAAIGSATGGAIGSMGGVAYVNHKIRSEVQRLPAFALNFWPIN